MKGSSKLGNPLFIIAVLILVLNDWYLKYHYTGWFTGKLSDFAGLFAFPFFLSAFFAGRSKIIYGFTLLLFVAWKTPLAQPVIDYLNNIGVPTWRTVDYTDYLALMILPLSLYCFNHSANYALKPVLLNIVIICSSLAFMATTRPKGQDKSFVYADKVYNFKFSKRELIARLNAIQLENVHDFDSYGYGKADFDTKSNSFYYNDKKDTLAVLLDYQRAKDTDTIRLTTSFAKINISGGEANSQIRLLSLKGYIRDSHKDDGKDDPLLFFERKVIRKINSYK